MAATSPRFGGGWLSRVLLCLLPVSLQGCSHSADLSINPFVNKNSANAFSLNSSEIQRNYNQSLANTHLAILGSQLPRSVILDSYWRFLSSKVAHATPETLQENMISLGYFSAPSLSVLKNYCNPRTPYVAAVLVRRKEQELASPPCDSKTAVIRVPVGHTVRGFIVPQSNRFATAISLNQLAELSRKQDPLKWSDLDSGWPSRPIRWVFNSQTDFKHDLQIIGITPPKHYQLAANYNRAFRNVGDSPDHLLFSPTSPAFKSRLEGAQFRILPIATNGTIAPVLPSADTLEQYPPAMIRTVYLYLNPANPNLCIMLGYADYLLKNNTALMNKDNFFPLLPAERQQALDDLARHHQESGSTRQPLCRAS